MKSIILAAGQGNRLLPLTNNTPKCLVKLFGKSLLEWQIDVFRRCNISDISVVTGFCSEKINFPNINYFKNPNYQTTNMVETLFCAKEKLNGSVIVSYGDIIFEKSVLQKLIDSKDDFSIVVDKNWEEYWKTRFENPLVDAESLIVDNNGYINNIGQNASNVHEICGQYIGLMKFQGEGLKYLKRFYEKTEKESKSGVNPLNPNLPFQKSFMTDLLQGLIESGCNLKAVFTNNGWLELDSMHDYKIYNKMYSAKTISKFFLIESS